MGISQYRLAKDINVPAVRINDIILGKRGISADTALRLAKFFGMSVEFWTGIQSEYEVAMAKNRIEDRLDREIRHRSNYFHVTVFPTLERLFYSSRLP